MRSYKYKYDITPVKFPNKRSKDGITTQMKYDIYGLHGAKSAPMNNKEWDQLKAWEELPVKEMLKIDLSKIRSGLAWRLYHMVRDRKVET